MKIGIIALRLHQGLLKSLADAACAAMSEDTQLVGVLQGNLDQPTEPSKLMPMRFCVSAMNSIGSFCSTSRTKPFTTSATASSCDRPRCMQ